MSLIAITKRYWIFNYGNNVINIDRSDADTIGKALMIAISKLNDLKERFKA